MKKARTLALCLALSLGSMAWGGQSAKAAGKDSPSPTSCALRPGQVAVLKTQTHGLDGVSLSLTWRGVTTPAFDEAPSDALVGEVMMRTCVQHTLLFALNYGPPYTKGAALRINPRTRQLERLDFAEKALPTYLDLGPDGMRLIFPNEGGEHDLKYTIYRSGQSESEPADDIPPPGPAFKRYRLGR